MSTMKFETRNSDHGFRSFRTETLQWAQKESEALNLTQVFADILIRNVKQQISFGILSLS